jgi:hypothetical protein
MTCGMESVSMAAERSTRRSTGKRAPRRTGSAEPEAERTKQSEQERRYVDIDPWGMLLEQLLAEPTDGTVGEGGAEDRRPAARAQPEAGSTIGPKRPKKRRGSNERE